jgi:hypothetical protein
MTNRVDDEPVKTEAMVLLPDPGQLPDRTVCTVCTNEPLGVNLDSGVVSILALVAVETDSDPPTALVKLLLLV